MSIEFKNPAAFITPSGNLVLECTNEALRILSTSIKSVRVKLDCDGAYMSVNATVIIDTCDDEPDVHCSFEDEDGARKFERKVRLVLKSA